MQWTTISHRSKLYIIVYTVLCEHTQNNALYCSELQCALLHKIVSTPCSQKLRNKYKQILPDILETVTILLLLSIITPPVFSSCLLLLHLLLNLLLLFLHILPHIKTCNWLPFQPAAFFSSIPLLIPHLFLSSSPPPPPPPGEHLPGGRGHWHQQHDLAQARHFNYHILGILCRYQASIIWNHVFTQSR